MEKGMNPTDFDEVVLRFALALVTRGNWSDYAEVMERAKKLATTYFKKILGVEP